MEQSLGLLPAAVAVGAFCVVVLAFKLVFDILYRISPSFKEWCDSEAEKFSSRKDDEYAE